jgi:hypothetical protein
LSNVEGFVSTLFSDVKPNGKKARSGSYYRYNRFRAINRKLGIVKKTGHWVIKETRKGRVGLGYLHKGKIHCGCGSCVWKTRDFGWKTSDQRKIAKCNYSLSLFTIAEQE